jgi:hypothetical protein
MEKLSKLFGPLDFVKVINPDTEPYIWQWLPPSKEDISFDGGTVPMKITTRGEPEVWKLEPGQSGTLVGGNAYVMIDGMVKLMMTKKTISRNPNMPPGVARNFNFSDDIAQQEWINQIYLGIDDPFASGATAAPAAQPNVDEIARQIDNDLGLTSAPRNTQSQEPRPVPTPVADLL